MLRTICFYGGLGNQMFQYAFYLSLKHKYPYAIYLFCVKGSRHCHNGFELSKVFKIRTLLRRGIYQIFNKLLKCSFMNEAIRNQAESLKYYSDVYEGIKGNVRFEGFWQSYKYFEGVENDIMKSFQFRKEKLSDKTKYICECICNSESVSMHIRRGDYITENRFIPSVEYYQKALDIIKKKNSHKGIKVFVFSDDIQWARENLCVSDAVYVDHNKLSDNWQDMFLMSQCKHNIITNSSFSWWAAWLNPNREKIIVAPNVWFEENEKIDLIPNNWIKI